MEARGGYDQPHVFNACIIGIMNHLVMSVITDLLSIGSKRVNDTCAYPGAWFTEFPGGSPVDHNPITWEGTGEGKGEGKREGNREGTSEGK